MKVYHGSTSEIVRPDLAYAKRSLDFGVGFYVTTIQSQAENWALRKALRNLSPYAFISIYDLKDDHSDYRKKVFSNEDREWVEFVCACRRGSDIYKQFDMISGGVANDKVYLAVDMYYRGIWDINRTLTELKYYERNDQICLLNQKLIDECLAFIESYEIKNND
jgi:hypothetical protein